MTLLKFYEIDFIIEDNKLKDEDLAKIKGITFIDSQNKFKFNHYQKLV